MIEIDSDALVLRLPPEKLWALKEHLASWRDRRSSTKSDLQSLAGSLQHACKVVRPGKTFLRRVFELLRAVHQSYHNIPLNSGMRSDLAWWDLFLDSWNGISLLWPHRVASPDNEFYTDASGAFGCGAIITVNSMLTKVNEQGRAGELVRMPGWHACGHVVNIAQLPGIASRLVAAGPGGAIFVSFLPC